jgi:AhpD family alkylhydroperoxidase
MTTAETLTQKEKELVAIAASIASGCLPCTTYHIKAVPESGASEAEVLGATRIALYVRDNATEMMAEAPRGGTLIMNIQGTDNPTPLHNRYITL